jgi:hypothetical protein
VQSLTILTELCFQSKHSDAFRLICSDFTHPASSVFIDRRFCLTIIIIISIICCLHTHTFVSAPWMSSRCHHNQIIRHQANATPAFIPLALLSSRSSVLTTNHLFLLCALPAHAPVALFFPTPPLGYPFPLPPSLSPRRNVIFDPIDSAPKFNLIVRSLLSIKPRHFIN